MMIDGRRDHEHHTMNTTTSDRRARARSPAGGRVVGATPTPPPPRATNQQTPNQGRFLGSVDIFRRHRRLVCEGELFKLGGTGKTGKSAQALDPRVVHLLSDVLLYSKVGRNTN